MRILEFILDVILRSLAGILAIHFMNELLETCGLATFVGVNPYSVLTIAILGIPGFIGLYFIGFTGLL